MAGWGQEWLRSDPQAQYFAATGNRAGWTPRMQDYYGGQYGNVWNQYLGALGRQVQAGQEPTLEWGNFLGTYPWMRSFQNLPRYQQGWNTGLFAPSMRYLLY